MQIPAKLCLNPPYLKFLNSANTLNFVIIINKIQQENIAVFLYLVRLSIICIDAKKNPVNANGNTSAKRPIVDAES